MYILCMSDSIVTIPLYNIIKIIHNIYIIKPRMSDSIVTIPSWASLGRALETQFTLSVPHCVSANPIYFV
jgi:hypothetical protein